MLESASQVSVTRIGFDAYTPAAHLYVIAPDRFARVNASLHNSLALTLPPTFIPQSMPVHITPSTFSRRRFVSSLLTAASGALATAAARTVPSLHAFDAGDKGREAWALLSDTHIAADPQFNARCGTHGQLRLWGVRDVHSLFSIPTKRTPFTRRKCD